MADLVAALYAIAGPLGLVVGILAAISWWRGRARDGHRVSGVKLALALSWLSTGHNREHFTVYRLLGAPEWLLNHWSVAVGMVVLIVAALMHFRLYRPRDIVITSVLVGGVATVAALAIIFGG